MGGLAAGCALHLVVGWLDACRSCILTTVIHGWSGHDMVAILWVWNAVMIGDDGAKIYPVLFKYNTTGRFKDVSVWSLTYKHSLFNRCHCSKHFSLLTNKMAAETSWHSASSLLWPFPMLKYKYIFKIKYTEAILSNSTVMVWNYQDADWSSRKKIIVSFNIIFGTLSFVVDMELNYKNVMHS